MEFSIARSVIESALSKVQSVADSKATIPILANVRIVSTDEGIEVTTTNLDRTIYSSLSSAQIQIDKPGSICAPARRLFDVVKSLPEGKVTFKLEDNNWVNVKGVKGRFKIPSPDASQFPDTPSYESVDWIEVPTKTMKSLVDGVLFAVSKNVNSININGALLEITDDEIKMVATDSHRMSIVSAPLSAFLSEDIKVLIPIESMNELSKLLSSSVETMSIAKDDNNVFFKMGSTVFVTRLSVGEFPNYSLVLPAALSNKLTVSNLPLLDSLKRSSLIANENTNHDVKFSIKNDSILLSAKQAEAGECDDQIDCVLDGDEIDIGINGGYIMDFLNLFKDEKIVVEFKNAESQMLMHPETSNGIEYRYVLMPVRI